MLRVNASVHKNEAVATRARLAALVAALLLTLICRAASAISATYLIIFLLIVHFASVTHFAALLSMCVSIAALALHSVTMCPELRWLHVCDGRLSSWLPDVCVLAASISRILLTIHSCMRPSLLAMHGNAAASSTAPPLFAPAWLCALLELAAICVLPISAIVRPGLLALPALLLPMPLFMCWSLSARRTGEFFRKLAPWSQAYLSAWFVTTYTAQVALDEGVNIPAWLGVECLLRCVCPRCTSCSAAAPTLLQFVLALAALLVLRAATLLKAPPVFELTSARLQEFAAPLLSSESAAVDETGSARRDDARVSEATTTRTSSRPNAYSASIAAFCAAWLLLLSCASSPSVPTLAAWALGSVALLVAPWWCASAPTSPLPRSHLLGALFVPAGRTPPRASRTVRGSAWIFGRCSCTPSAFS